MPQSALARPVLDAGRMIRPSLIVIALTLAVPSAATAQQLELQLAVGLTDCTDDYCDDGTLVFEETHPGIGLFGAGWLRLHPFVSVGLGVHGSFIAVDEQDGVDATTTFLNVEGALRMHVPLDVPVDPYAGLGFGWSWASTSYESDLDDGSATLDGPTMGIHLGVDYLVTPELGVGALFKYYVPFWSDYCYDSEAFGDDCEDPEDAFDDDDLPNAWFFGANLTFRPGARPPRA
jgi:hypothetical protein